MKKELKISSSPMFKFLMNPTNTRGEIIGNYNKDGLFIDTCFTNDTGKYETYIRNVQGFAVVEIYKNKENAIKGHKKWVKFAKENPDFKPVEINFEGWIGLK